MNDKTNEQALPEPAVLNAYYTADQMHKFREEGIAALASDAGERGVVVGEMQRYADELALPDGATSVIGAVGKWAAALRAQPAGGQGDKTGSSATKKRQAVEAIEFVLPHVPKHFRPKLEQAVRDLNGMLRYTHPPAQASGAVTEAMVDRGAKKLADEYDRDRYWEEMGEADRDHWRIQARQVLTAAITQGGGDGR